MRRITCAMADGKNCAHCRHYNFSHGSNGDLICNLQRCRREFNVVAWFISLFG